MAAGHPRVRIDHTELFALGAEREPLVMNLDAQREGLIRKIEGLDDAMERQALTASSSSLLGLVKHAVTWERRWRVGQPTSPRSTGWSCAPDAAARAVPTARWSQTIPEVHNTTTPPTAP